MTHAVLVGFGGVVGALARHLVGTRLEQAYVDTLAVNVLGSFLLGVIVAAPVGDPLVAALGTGFCGAFTTFSTFAFETVRLYEEGHRRNAVFNAVTHLVLALLAVGAGTFAVGLLIA